MTTKTTSERYLKASDVKKMIHENKSLQKYFPWAENMFLELIDDIPDQKEHIIKELIYKKQNFHNPEWREFAVGYDHGYKKAIDDALEIVVNDKEALG